MAAARPDAGRDGDGRHQDHPAQVRHRRHRTPARDAAVAGPASGIGATVVKEDRPEIRGMVRAVTHLVHGRGGFAMSEQATRDGRRQMLSGRGLKVHHLRPAPGAKKAKTRVGRGEGSKGKTAGRGTKGTEGPQEVPARFEGGQMPLHMRLPKLKGFTNPAPGRVPGRQPDQARPSSSRTAARSASTIWSRRGAVRKDSRSRCSATASVAVAMQVSVNAFSSSAKEKIVGSRRRGDRARERTRRCSMTPPSIRLRAEGAASSFSARCEGIRVAGPVAIRLLQSPEAPLALQLSGCPP